MRTQSDGILKILAGYPCAGLLPKPSPIHKLPRISQDLGQGIYILRDDLTGFALGGNKTRKLDFLIGDAVTRKADTLVTMKATSFSRNAAAAGRVYGLDLHVVLPGCESDQNPWSQAFFEQYEARLHYVSESGQSALIDAYNGLVNYLKAQGKAIYELHPGGSDSIGSLGYVAAFQEILDYSQEAGIHFSDIVLSVGSTGTQAGLLIGRFVSGYETRIVGIAASLNADLQSRRIHDLVSSMGQLLGVETDKSGIIVDDHFIGPGYALPSEEGRRAVKVFASREGILLDPVYTGKAAAALLDYSKKGTFQGDNVLFIHTGGNSGLYY